MATLIQSDVVLMGSPFSIQAHVPENENRQKILTFFDMAFGEVRRIENELTDFKSSPFNRINELAGMSPVRVSREIWNLIETSIRISKDSEGAFDISYAAIGHLWREAFVRGTPPSERDLEKARKWVDYRRIEMDPDNQTVYLPAKQMRIGLGGIGKGYAVDKAYELLRSVGLGNICVNGAGDIRVHSEENAPRGWRVGIRNPLAKRDVSMGMLEMAQGAVATSGDYERFFRYEEQKFHHVLDGRTGHCTDEIISATVFAPTATTADVLATTAMILGSQKGIEFLNSRRHVSGFLVTRLGQVIQSLPEQERKVS